MDPTVGGIDMNTIALFMPILTIAGAGAMLWWNNKRSKDSEVKKSAHDVENQASVDKIESIHLETSKVVAEIKDLNKKSADKQIEMRNVIEEANKKIEALDKAETIEEINNIMGR